MIKNQDLETITEGTTEVLVFKNKYSDKGPGSKNNLPFYNPSMELNRDLSILVCQWMTNNSKKSLNLLDGLAASGIRGLRLAKELDGDFEVTINDWNEKAFNLIEKNAESSKCKNVILSNKNLNTLLCENKYDYIDIDPFGSPVFFIDSAMKSITNNGIISCTATDTATLCGVYPKVCMRRYNAIPFHSVVMKEVGLRILIGIICREAGKYDKGIDSLVCYSTDHYFRVYVRIRNGVGRANESMKDLQVIKSDEKAGFEAINKDIGPLWTGKLHNKQVIKELRTILFDKKLNTKNNLWKLLDLLEGESEASRFFYTTDSLSSFLKKSPPKLETIFNTLKTMGYTVCKTHFSSTGFKTNAPLDQIERIFVQRK
jgi:tRNA (guanine26-N2/guanine27-N2)-dimethyltransferase